ncbi:hypothetical protein, partial [Proteus mirabilis]|uniref:hypothetical protein n=1 Tax=Proteus mirabilis TaxID=584 RepID=UPI0019542B91
MPSRRGLAWTGALLEQAPSRRNDHSRRSLRAVRRSSHMKALCWHGKNDIRCDTVPDPTIEDARDV